MIESREPTGSFTLTGTQADTDTVLIAGGIGTALASSVSTLHYLTGDDLAAFDAVGVKAVYDLRRPGEIARFPPVSCSGSSRTAVSPSICCSGDTGHRLQAEREKGAPTKT